MTDGPGLDVAVRHRFGAFALDAAFTTPATGVTALFGPSGAGKSSVIAAIAGLLRPDEARIAMAGRVLTETRAATFVRPHRRRIGLVFQDARLFPHLSVRGNLLYGWRRTGRRASAADVAAVVETLGIGALLPRRPFALSGGERQRVALGRALLSGPDLLLLDEPLAALDHARKAEIMGLLERLRDDARVPMLYVSHAIDEVARLADHIVLLDGGQVAAAGPVFDILSRLDLMPLTGRHEAGAVLAATVAGHDPADGLTELAFAGGRLVVPRLDHPLGAPVRVRVTARDVTLALSEPQGISANNVLAATVLEVRAGDGALTDVRLDCGGTVLLAEVTRRSAARLVLAPGLPLYAIIKSVTVDRGRFGDLRS